MFMIHIQDVSPLLKRGHLNGTICKGYENSVSAVLSLESDMLSHLEDELECSLALTTLDYTSLRDDFFNSYFALV